MVPGTEHHHVPCQVMEFTLCFIRINHYQEEENVEFSGASIMTKGVNFKQECIDECYLRCKVIIQIMGIGNVILTKWSC